MKKYKNIDELFKKQFNNFEAAPSPRVWENIEAQLKEEDDRKVIPLWFKLGGIAALLALLFTIGNSVFNPSNNNTSAPIVTRDATEIKKENTEENKLQNNIINEKDYNEKIASEDKVNKTEITNKNSEKSHSNNNSTIDKTRIASENTNEKVLEKAPSRINNNSITNASDKVGVASVEENKSVSEKKNEDFFNKNTSIDSNKVAVASEEVNKSNNSLESDSSENKLEENKKSIFDAIDETSKEEVATITKDNKPDNRWDVAPNVGPIYYSSLSEGSSIDPAFSDNPKNSNLTIAYGVNVSYHLNKRLSIRSGLSNVNLSYSTTGLDLGTGPVAASTSSIDYPTRGNVTIVVDKGTLINQNPDGEFGDVSPKSTSGEVVLSQDLSYYEVPLELKYAVLNKRFGINVIGGFSTLFLGNNEVSVDAGNFNDVLGEANNLSSLSFTTNLGLGLNYSFSKKLMFNIEPMFKYQLNPYTDTSVDFKPYYIGIYSGLSFKF